MLRIIGIQRNEVPAREFLLLQNQGAMRVNLRGHAILSDCALDGEPTQVNHAFGDDANILPGNYVVLFSGPGEAKFVKGKDGALVYYAYMGKGRSVWEHQLGSIHVLATQHTYCERGPALFLK